MLVRFPSCLSLAPLHVLITQLCKGLSLCSYHCQCTVYTAAVFSSDPSLSLVWLVTENGRRRLFDNGLEETESVLVQTWNRTGLS